MIQTFEEDVKYQIDAAQALVDKLMAENSQLVEKVWCHAVKCSFHWLDLGDIVNHIKNTIFILYLDAQRLGHICLYIRKY